MVAYNELFNKINAAEDYLNSVFIEREALISLLLLTIFSGQNMFILGKPGVAKSEIVYQTSLLFKDVKIFRYLLTKYTTPEEIFGSISLEELKKDRFYRKITKKLADVEIGFLDEIFKGNSSILNSLLMIANEKIYINDTEVVEVPLISLFGASNEIPDEEEMEELQALYDRFTIKYIAEPIKEYKNFTMLLLQDNKEIKMDDRMLIDLNEIFTVQEAAGKITPGQNILNLMYKVREYCYENNYYVSDRKFKNMLGILKVGAFVNGRSEIITEDLFILPYMIWEKPEEFSVIKEDIENIIIEHIFNNIISSISIKISNSFSSFIDDLITTSGNCYNEYVKCYSYLKQKQKDDLVIQDRLIREYLYKITKIIEQLTAEMESYHIQYNLRFYQLVQRKILFDINKKKSEFTNYQITLTDLKDKIQAALQEEEQV